MDFVVALGARGDWRVYAVEINLRKGGTTHPFLTLQFLTDGSYDARLGVFKTPSGQEKAFIADDDVESSAYRVFAPSDLFEIIATHGLHFNQTSETGVVFYMMSALGECGRLGLVAVGNTAREAADLFNSTMDVLDREAAEAAKDQTV